MKKLTSIESTNIFKSAYYICMGADLSEIRFNHKQIAPFLITGSDLDRFDRDYANGKALVNPVQFRQSLNWLRDVLFEKLRERRYDDQPRKNRCYQAGYGY